MDIWITAFFAVVLTVKGAGELAFAFSVVAALVMWKRSKLLIAEVDRVSLRWIALAIASLPCLKALSVLWSIDPGRTITDVGTHLHFIFWLPLTLLFLRAREPLEAFVRGLLWAAALMVIWAITHAIHYGIHVPPLNADGRLEAGAQNPGVLGQLATVCALSLAVATALRYRFMHLCGTSVMTLTVVLAAGRSHMLALGIGLLTILIAILFSRGDVCQRGSRRGAAWLVLPAVLAWGGLIAMTPAFQQALQEFRGYQTFNAAPPPVGSAANTPPADAVQHAVGNSVGNRAALYDIATRAFPDSPVLGFGAGSTQAIATHYAGDAVQFMWAAHFHQQYLQVLLETGVIGAIAASAALCAIAMWFWRRTVAKRQLRWTAMALIGTFGVVGLFTGVLQQGLVHSFATMMLAVLAAEVLKRPDRGFDRLGAIPTS